MRVLFQLLDAGVGGGQRVALAVAGELVARGHEVGLVTPRPGPSADPFAALGAAPLWLETGTLRRPGVALRLARGLGGYDVLYSHTSAPGQIVGAAAARLAGRPHVVHHHTSPYFSPRGAVARAQRALYRRLLRSSRVIAVAAHVRDELLALGLPAENVAVVPNGVALPAVEAGPAGRNGPIRIGMLARMDPGKGIDTFVAAATRMGRGAGASFVLGCVPGPYPEFEAEARRAAAAAGVEVSESSDGAEAFLRSLDVVVLPSYYEGSPLTLLEAMGLAKPVVASDIPGVSEVLAPNAGLLVPAGDAAALAESLAGLVGDPERRARLGARAREVVAERYRLDRMLERVVGELLGAAARRPGPA